MRRLRVVASILVVFAAVAVIFAWLIWPAILPSLIFAPRVLPDAHRAPATWGYEGVEVGFVNATGDTLHGWLLHHTSTRPIGCTVLFLHGNAGNVSSQASFMRSFLAAGFDALVFDYGGYGASGGAPSEDGLYSDAATAYRYLRQEHGVPGSRLVLVGHSLGTAVATWLAARHESGGVVLAAPFTSLPDAMKTRVGWLPVQYLRWRTSRFDSGSRIDSVAAAMLFVVGEGDRLVPKESARDLYEMAASPKQWVEVPGGHNEIFRSDVFTSALVQFVERRTGCTSDVSNSGTV